MTSVASYDLNDAYQLTYTLTNAAGVPTNATVVVTVTKPDGTADTPTLTNPSTGTYVATGVCTAAGVWLYTFTATGALTDSEPGRFYVTAAVARTVYTTLPELKSALSIPATDTADDDDLQDAILTASRAIDGDCQRHFYQVTEARTFAPTDTYRIRFGPYMDLVSVTTLQTDASGDGTWETTWTTGDFQLLCVDGTPNINAGPEARPYRRIKAVGALTFPIPSAWSAARDDLVKITGVWGWPTVPDRIRRACRMAAAETFRLRDAPLGALGMADLGIIRVRENVKYQRLIGDYRIMPVPVA
jgi:hypothetical protein